MVQSEGVKVQVFEKEQYFPELSNQMLPLQTVPIKCLWLPSQHDVQPSTIFHVAPEEMASVHLLGTYTAMNKTFRREYRLSVEMIKPLKILVSVRCD